MDKKFEDKITFEGYRKVGESVNEILSVDLEMDLIFILAFDLFLGEN